MPTGQCRLCRAHSELQLSHILPAFVFRWLRSSGSGYMRGVGDPNRRVQDGPKLYWLCSSCEELLSVSEGQFASKLFHPVTNDSKKTVRYSSWLMHFCTSLSWRVLRFHLEQNKWDGWSEDSMARVHNAELMWREVLLGTLPHAGLLQQHILPLSSIERAGGALAPNINRYLLRAVDIDVLRSEKAIYTYAKLGRFVVLGFIHEPNMGSWGGTKVLANEGFIEPERLTIPASLWRYLNEKAASTTEAFSSMSAAQQAKILKSVETNVDRLIDSDAFAAMHADVAMFGDAAFK